MRILGFKFAALSSLLAVTACMTVPEDFVWGNNSSQWANDGDCDDPRFTGPWAHSLLVPEDAFSDANDCRALFAEGKVFLRANYQEGVTYENPGYVGPN